MKSTFASVLVGLTAIALADAAPITKPAPMKDKPTLVGEWVVKGVTFNGTDISGQVCTIRYTFQADGTWVDRQELQGMPVGTNGPETHWGSDPAADPPSIDLMRGRPGPNQMIFRGIYKVDGDTLVICYPARPKSPRPTKFESAEDSMLFLFTLKRVPPKN
jgi:uncharacterized protein (TIGR03067 family)